MDTHYQHLLDFFRNWIIGLISSLNAWLRSSLTHPVNSGPCQSSALNSSQFLCFERSLFYYGRLVFVLSLLFSSMCFAGATEMYPLNSKVDTALFQQMIQEMRCLVCQNQNLADSNAPLAQDLRQIIYEKIKKGESEQAIKKYLVSCYGEYILFKPTFLPLTYLLWLGPFVLLLIVTLKVIVHTSF